MTPKNPTPFFVWRMRKLLGWLMLAMIFGLFSLVIWAINAAPQSSTTQAPPEPEGSLVPTENDVSPEPSRFDSQAFLASSPTLDRMSAEVDDVRVAMLRAATKPFDQAFGTMQKQVRPLARDLTRIGNTLRRTRDGVRDWWNGNTRRTDALINRRVRHYLKPQKRLEAAAVQAHEASNLILERYLAQQHTHLVDELRDFGVSQQDIATVTQQYRMAIENNLTTHISGQSSNRAISNTASSAAVGTAAATGVAATVAWLGGGAVLAPKTLGISVAVGVIGGSVTMLWSRSSDRRAFQRDFTNQLKDQQNTIEGLLTQHINSDMDAIAKAMQERALNALASIQGQPLTVD